MTESIALQTARTHAINHPQGRADVLLSRLHGVMKSGNGWRARCPSCDSRRRDNVSIAEMDGRVLVYCFGGCTRDDVLAAWRASPPEPGQTAAPLNSNALEVYVHRLRKKLDQSSLNIRNIRGLGYMLEKP